MKIFIRLAIAASILPMLTACCNKCCDTTQPEKKEIGLQLYSARNLLAPGGKFENNLPALLDTLASMGYTHFEAANYNGEKFYDMTPEELKAAADSAGVRINSSHTGRTLSDEELQSGDLTGFRAWWEKAIADHKAAGIDYIVVPWMSVPKTLPDLQKQIEALNEAGRMATAQGIKLGYHNHAHEFEQVEGNTMLDYMIENSDPDALFFEMDVYWAVMGKASPVDYFNKYPGRFKLLHIKDRREIGQSGMVGFDAIFNNTDKAGTTDYFVEIEETTGDLESGLQESAAYITAAPFVKACYNQAATN